MKNRILFSLIRRSFDIGGLLLSLFPFSFYAASKSENRKYALLILFSLIYFSTFSQGEFVVEIKKTTGAFTKTGPPITGITYIYPDDRTYDENSATFIFPSAQLNHSLYSIDVYNGSIVHNPIINNISKFEFDNASNVLYGLEQDNPNNVKKFISINPATGTYTQKGNSIPNSSLFGGATSTFNKINHAYIFLDPPNILYSINAADGTIISNPNLSLALGESLINFAFDNSTGSLYGLLQDNNLQKYFLVSINPTTGTTARIGLGTTFGAGLASSAIDEKNQQYIYLYSSSVAGGYAVTTLDIATGSVAYNALVQPYIASDNFFSLKYDNIQEKLYAIHWETFTLPIANFISNDSIFCAESSNCIDFIDYSFGNPTTWQWQFPGAIPDNSTQQNPTSICYTQAGTYAVTLIVSNANGNDTLTVSSMITVGATPPPFNVIASGNILTSAAGGSAYQWYFNGLPIAGATDSFYVANTYGNYSVMITDGFGCRRLSNGVWASVNELNVGGGVTIYPNPVGDQLTIDNGQLTMGNTVVLEIYNVLGERVLQSEITNKKSEINVSALAKGIYIVKLSNNEKVFRAKFVKK